MLNKLHHDLHPYRCCERGCEHQIYYPELLLWQQKHEPPELQGIKNPIEHLDKPGPPELRIPHFRWSDRCEKNANRADMIRALNTSRIKLKS